MEHLHERIAADLRGRILAGELPVGSPIPSEAQLAEQWQVSRAPVRQALAAIRAEGLIGGGQGKQATVRARSVGQLFETFLSFTRWVVDMGRLPGQRTVEVARRPAPPTPADALEIDAGTPLVQVTRLRLIDGEPVMVERSSFVDAIGRLLFDFDCDSGSIYEYLIGCGVDLSVARHTVDAVGADDLDAELLGIPTGSPLLRERRLAGSADGVRYEYAEDRYRPDRVAFTIDNASYSRPSLSRTQPVLSYLRST